MEAIREAWENSLLGIPITTTQYLPENLIVMTPKTLDALKRMMYQHPALSSPRPEAREEDIAKQGNDLLDALWKIIEGEAEWRNMTLWTPFDPVKQVSGLTRGDLESIFNQYRVFSPVRDFLSRLAAPKPEGQDIIRCEITAGEYPDRISVKPPADTFERGLVVMGAMVDLVFSPAAPEPRPAEEPAPSPSEEEWSAIKRILNETDCTDGQFLAINGHIDALRSQLAQATNNAQFWMGENSKTTRYYEAQLARKDEGMRDLVEEALGTIESTVVAHGWWSSWADRAHVALREPDGRKGE